MVKFGNLLIRWHNKTIFLRFLSRLWHININKSEEKSNVLSDEFAAKSTCVGGFRACSGDNIYRGVLDTRVSNMLRVGAQISNLQHKNLWIQKHTDT